MIPYKMKRKKKERRGKRKLTFTLSGEELLQEGKRRTSAAHLAAEPRLALLDPSPDMVNTPWAKDGNSGAHIDQRFACLLTNKNRKPHKSVWLFDGKSNIEI